MTIEAWYGSGDPMVAVWARGSLVGVMPTVNGMVTRPPWPSSTASVNASLWGPTPSEAA